MWFFSQQKKKYSNNFTSWKTIPHVEKQNQNLTIINKQMFEQSAFPKFSFLYLNDTGPFKL